MTASVVDYYGRKKKGYFALQQAFSPIHVLMDWPDLAGEAAGSTFRRALYGVNDYATEYPSLTVSWQVLGAADDVLAAGSTPCTVPANSLSPVGEVSWPIPFADGRYRVSLTLERNAEILSTNSYTVHGRAGVIYLSHGAGRLRS